MSLPLVREEVFPMIIDYRQLVAYVDYHYHHNTSFSIIIITILQRKDDRALEGMQLIKYRLHSVLAYNYMEEESVCILFKSCNHFGEDVFVYQKLLESHYFDQTL